MSRSSLALLVLLSTSRVIVAENTPPSSPQSIVIGDGPSIQQAIDANRGKAIFVPSGDYSISKAIQISTSGAGLFGPGRIIQTNPQEPIIVVSHADDVQIRDLTCTRPADTDGSQSGVVASSCRNLVVDNVQVIDNRAASASINLDKCVNGRVTNCVVRNYSRVAIDDRTDSPNYGFAFKCFDGTGMEVSGCQGMIIQGNRIEELHNVPTKEIKERLGLGKFTNKNAAKGAITSQEVWDKEEYPQWHQGSAIHIGEPESSDQIQLIANQIENAAQGIDIHSDHVIVSQNIVNNAAVGMKAMHGSRNILITGNQFNRCCAHAILLQPGAGSHPAGQNSTGQPSDTVANVDGASIIANNIISDFGYGDSNWIWGNERDAISLEPGQTPVNPPLEDIVVQGNIVYDPGRDKLLVDGKATTVPPRYRYALLISKNTGDLKGPIRVKVRDNIFDPGSGGISNVPALSK